MGITGRLEVGDEYGWWVNQVIVYIISNWGDRVRGVLTSGFIKKMDTGCGCGLEQAQGVVWAQLGLSGFWLLNKDWIRFWTWTIVSDHVAFKGPFV